VLYRASRRGVSSHVSLMTRRTRMECFLDVLRVQRKLHSWGSGRRNREHNDKLRELQGEVAAHTLPISSLFHCLAYH
jgi:hypothetical protein